MKGNTLLKGDSTWKGGQLEKIRHGKDVAGKDDRQEGTKETTRSTGVSTDGHYGAVDGQVARHQRPQGGV